MRIEVKNRYARELLAAIDSTPVTKFANRLRSVLALIPQSGDMCLAKAAGAWRCRYAGELPMSIIAAHYTTLTPFPSLAIASSRHGVYYKAPKIAAESTKPYPPSSSSESESVSLSLLRTTVHLDV